MYALFSKFLTCHRAFVRAQEGVAATEFALIAPILAFMLISTFDYGMYINMLMRLENVARSSAEYVLKGGDPDLIDTDVIQSSDLPDSVKSNIEPDISYVCSCYGGDVVSCSTGSCDMGDYKRRFVEISLTTNYQTAFPYPFLPDEMQLAGRVKLQVE